MLLDLITALCWGPVLIWLCIPIIVVFKVIGLGLEWLFGGFDRPLTPATPLPSPDMDAWAATWELGGRLRRLLLLALSYVWAQYTRS